MSRFFYEVTATLHDESIVEAWTRWMQGEHIADVVRAGACSGRLIRLDGETLRFAIQYEFDSREAFEQYLRDHAPRLRAEGVARFPADQVSYERRTGEFLDS